MNTQPASTSTHIPAQDPSQDPSQASSPVRAPAFFIGQATRLSNNIASPPEHPYYSEIRALHSLGWNVSNIVKSIPDESYQKSCHVVKQITIDLEPLTFRELFPLIPFDRLIDPSVAEDFKANQARRLDPLLDKERLSTYDVHLMGILVMIGWKKKRVAKIYQVSSALVSTYTASLVSYSVDELRDLFPSIVPPPKDITAQAPECQV